MPTTEIYRWAAAGRKRISDAENRHVASLRRVRFACIHTLGGSVQTAGGGSGSRHVREASSCGISRGSLIIRRGSVESGGGQGPGRQTGEGEKSGVAAVVVWTGWSGGGGSHTSSSSGAASPAAAPQQQIPLFSASRQHASSKHGLESSRSQEKQEPAAKKRKKTRQPDPKGPTCMTPKERRKKRRKKRRRKEERKKEKENVAASCCQDAAEGFQKPASQRGMAWLNAQTPRNAAADPLPAKRSRASNTDCAETAVSRCRRCRRFRHDPTRSAVETAKRKARTLHPGHSVAGRKAGENRRKRQGSWRKPLRTPQQQWRGRGLSGAAPSREDSIRPDAESR